MIQQDKRKTPRVPINAPAMLQTLGASAGTNGAAVPVHVLDASERGMKLRTDGAFSVGQAVKIELKDAMFLGEICYCAPIGGDASNGYQLGLVIQECLTGLSSLQHLIRALQPQAVNETERVR